MNDEEYMKIALDEAKKGMGCVSPNPLVGAVIVKDGRIISKGYHHYCGGLHAERDALANCSEETAGAIMYVTLEPCCHTGRQPPCTQAIIDAGISRVVVGAGDPNPLVAGKGSQILRDKGIEVTEYVLEKECREINEIFFHYISTRRPFVTMKYAMTMDGKIATKCGLSKWITGESARRQVHFDRNKYTAIMAGIGTVLADDPELTCRIEGGRNPVRIICDTHLKTPLNLKIVTTANNVRTLICTSQTDKEMYVPYTECGCEIVYVPEKDGHIDIDAMMRILGEMEIDSILLEGGGMLNWSVLKAKAVSKVQTYIAPKIFGGSAKSPVEGDGIEDPAEAYILTDSKIMRFENGDIMIESKVRYDVHGDS